MKEVTRNNDEISVYIENQEYVANTYVMKCFTIMMVLYTLTFILNLLNVFIVDKQVMLQGYVPSVVIFLVVYIITRKLDLSNRRAKYFILFSVITVFTIIGVSLTYHAVLISLLPFLYATLYSSKKIMKYVYGLTVLSTFIIVYGGYFWGLCDANMALLTTSKLQEHLENGYYTLTEVNPNPYVSLGLFFVLPRCLIYIAFSAVCSSLYNVLSGSLEKAKLTAELEKAKEEAEEANRTKTQFLAKMSHEIRTPVNAVLGMNEIIMRESTESNIRKYAEDVKDSSVALLGIINEILDSSKIESGMLEIINVDYEIASLLNDLYNMINIKAKEKNLKLVFDVEKDMPSVFHGDDRRIRQILLNLLTNAVKYTDKGHVTLKLSCTIDGDNAVLHYSVQDTGIGIREENIDKIYDAFQRFDMSRNRDIEGTGLGMNIAQQFLKLMGSELNIQSEYEKGSRFSFDIVQQIADRTPMGDLSGKLQEVTESRVYVPDYVAPQARILLVDDNYMNRKVVQGLMKQTQVQIFEAQSGKECLEMLKNGSFDLIFLDHMMPGMDGMETFRSIKENHLADEVPIVMLTANALVGNREKYIEKGFDDFLSKPIMPEELDKIMLKYLPKGLIQKAVEEQYTEDGAVCGKTEATGTTNEIKEEWGMETLRERFPELDLEKGVANCGGEEEFYLEIFDDFIHLKIKKQLEEYLEKADYKNYCIAVHGFKNNAYSVGAMALGDLAYEMEKMTRESMPDNIEEYQKKLFEQYDRYCRE